LQFERKVSEAAAEWKKGEEDVGLLWSGTRLTRTSEWAHKHETEVPPKVRAFLDACQQQARLALKAKRRGTLFFVLVSEVLLMLIGFMGWTKYRARKEPFRENIVSYEGSMWTRNDNRRDVNWQQADQYCRTLNLVGLSGWQLPRIDELEKLYDPQNSSKYKIRPPFRLTAYWVWSSTLVGSDSASGCTFFLGSRSVTPMANSGLNRALCVRRSGK